MPRTGADYFAEALAAYGVSRVFGNPGTTELPITSALGESDLEYVLALHEDVAVGAAAGYATTRRYHAHGDPAVLPLGVVNLHIAPGTAHGLGNVLDASHTGAPLLVTAGDHPLGHGQREPNLAGDTVAMTEEFTKWSARVETVATLPTMLRRAVRTALTPPTGPVFLSLPLDVMRAETDASPERLGATPDAGRGDPRQVALAADALVAADEPVFVVGDAVARADAVPAAVALAEATGARVHGEFKAAEVAFPTGHDQWGGRLPRDQSRAAALLDADTVALLGVVSNVPTNPVEVELVPSRATCVQVSPSAWELGKNYVADVAALGDPARVLRELTERVTARLDEDERERRRSVVAEAVARERERDGLDVERSARPDDPRTSVADLAAALREVAPGARVVAEAPTSVGAVREAYDFGPGDFFANRGGGLGYGLPAAVGAAVAERHRDDARDVVGVIGDGSYLYYPHALYTAARESLDLTVVVVDNRNYRILKDNTQRLFGGTDEDHEYVGMDFDPPVDFAANAESHGATGRLVEGPDDLRPALREAVASHGPSVVDVPVHD
ncbi:MAG: thiamine pyrophosphate-binding protein [Haloferacaceae archaeon]